MSIISTALFCSAPRIDGRCSLNDSKRDSLTFSWDLAKSATHYRLVGHGVDETSSVNTITVDGLTPGSDYTFTVWAVGFRRLHSNNITCNSSTGISCGCSICVGIRQGIWSQTFCILRHIFTFYASHLGNVWIVYLHATVMPVYDWLIYSYRCLKQERGHIATHRDA